MDKSLFNKIRVEIITCTSLDRLQQIQAEFQRIVDAQAPGTSYSKKLESENINSIFKLVQSKQNQLSRVNFKFIGKPQPPTHANNSRLDSDAFSQFTSNSINVCDKEYQLNSDDHVYISKFANSFISLKSRSINLQNGNECICYLQSAGPVFIQNASNCIFIISCHQVRLHQIRDSIVIVEDRDRSGNPIIIENCSRLCINEVDVDDFNHPSKASKSPNYDTLSDEQVKRIKQEIRGTTLSNLKTSLSDFICKESQSW